MTPSARQFLIDKGIEILKDGAVVTNSKKAEVEEKKEIVEKIIEKPITPKYIGLAGESYFEKPEHMTQI